MVTSYILLLEPNSLIRFSVASINESRNQLGAGYILQSKAHFQGALNKRLTINKFN